MPIIRIDFDDNVVPESEIKSLSIGFQEIVSRVTGIEDVFVYANSAQIKYKVAPIEIFVEMSASKIPDLDALMLQFKTDLREWKESIGFTHSINLTVNPQNWKFEVGI